MSACEQNPKEKAAVLTLKLRADSGYEADAEYRISAEQWGEVLGICEGPRQAAAEAQQAGPAWLTDEEIMQAVRHISFNEMTAFNIGRAIETAVLERNGLKLQAKADSSDFRRGHAEPVNARMLEALKEVVRISDRKHDAWDVAKAAIASAESQQAGPVRLTDGWISVADAMPNTQQQVDIAYIDHHGQHQTTMGWYCRAKTLESSSFDGEVDEEYDEETDTYYMKEQWVDESQEAEYHYPINNVTHWKPRAKHPDFNPQAKGD